MDLLNLGAQSRKTGIKPRQNLTKDKYDMEDIDEFFADDDELSRIHRRSNTSRSRKSTSAQSSTPKDNFDNVARFLNFTDAEAENFNLSPISLSSKLVPNKDNKKSPLLSPLAVRRDNKEYDRVKTKGLGKQQLAKNDISEVDDDLYDYEPDFYDDHNDNGQSFEEHLSLSPVPLSPVLPISGNGKKTSSTPKSKSTSSKLSSALTKRMALGKSSKSSVPKVLEQEESDEGVLEAKSNNESSELLSPPPTNKRSSKEKPAKSTSTISKPSPLPSPPPDGLRRSKRTRVRPVAFWRNEKVRYRRANENSQDPNTTLGSDIKNIPLQEIQEVVHIPEPASNNTLAPSRKRSRLKSRTTPPKFKKATKKEVYDYESDPEISGSEWFKNDTLQLEVFENEKKVRTLVAYTPDGADLRDPPAPQEGDENFKVATLFEHDKDFSASGLLEFDFGGYKQFRNSGEFVYSFHVVKGLIEVTLNNTKFVVTRGCSFQVPDGNSYGFKNIGQDSARLFFVQCKIPRTEHENTTRESDDGW